MLNLSPLEQNSVVIFRIDERKRKEDENANKSLLL